MNLDSSPFLLTELLRNGAIKLRLTSFKRDGILDELVALIPEIQDNSDAKTTLLRALREREQLHSTGIGGGIALPHARNALAGVVDRAVIVFGRHEKGIAYGAVDGAPARLFFMLVAPTIQQHLAILARISRLLRDVKLRDELLTTDKPDRVIQTIHDAESRM